MSQSIKTKVIHNLASFGKIESTKIQIVSCSNSSRTVSKEDWLKECISRLSDVDSEDFDYLSDLYDTIDKSGSYLMY